MLNVSLLPIYGIRKKHICKRYAKILYFALHQVLIYYFDKDIFE